MTKMTDILIKSNIYLSLLNILIITIIIGIFVYQKIKQQQKSHTENFAIDDNFNMANTFDADSQNQATKTGMTVGDSYTEGVLNELRYEFLGNNFGYIRLGSFMMQWGFSGAGMGGKSINPQGQNPVMAWGLGISVGITLDILSDREAWETGVSLNQSFDEIYGAHVMPYGNKDRVIYENIKIKEMNNNKLIVRTGNYHSPFLWIAYGLKCTDH